MPDATIERTGSTQLIATRPEGEVVVFCDMLMAALDPRGAEAARNWSVQGELETIDTRG